MIWVPPSFTKRVVADCSMCDTVFYEGEELQRTQHIARCFKRHEQRMQEMAPSVRYPFIYKQWEPDYEGYVKRTGKLT